MPTYDTDILVTTTGIDVGSTTARVDVFAQDVDISGTASIGNFNGIIYVDGTNYAQTAAGIQAAIDAATTDQIVEVAPVLATIALGATTINLNKRVWLRLGTNQYTSTADPAINISVDGARLTGAGMLSTKITNATTAANVVKIAQGTDDVIVEDLWLAAAGKTVDEANFDQGNCLFAGEGGGGDAASTVINRLIVQRVYGTGGNNGVVFRYVDKGAVLGCNFNFSHNGLSQVLLINGNYNRIAHNAFVSSGATDNAIYIRNLNAAADVESTHNTVNANTIDGDYDFEAINCTGQYNSITGNSIRTTSAAANSAGISIFHSAAASVAHTASRTHHNSVTGNTIEITGAGGAGTYGIFVVDNGSTGPYGSNDNVISGNVVTVPGHGIAVLDDCLRNTISGNRIEITGGTAKSGIQLTGPDSADTVIVGNIISGATGSGIYTSTSLRPVIVGNEVISSTDQGILTDDSVASNAIIAFNTLRNNGAYGVALGTSNTGTLVFGNRYISNTSGTFLTNSSVTQNVEEDQRFTGKVTTYNSINTVSGGVPAEYATVDLTAQTAAVGTTTLYAVPATGVGQYRVSWNAKVTTAATTGAATSTLGALTIVYTDPDSVVQTITAGALVAAGTIATTSTGNSTTTVLLGVPLVLNCKASTNITYAMGYASDTANQMAYNLHIKVEALG